MKKAQKKNQTANFDDFISDIIKKVNILHCYFVQCTFFNLHSITYILRRKKIHFELIFAGYIEWRILSKVKRAKFSSSNEIFLPPSAVQLCAMRKEHILYPLLMPKKYGKKDISFKLTSLCELKRGKKYIVYVLKKYSCRMRCG